MVKNKIHFSHTGGGDNRYLMLSGGQMSGCINTKYGAPGINFRTGHNSYNAMLAYYTPGNEAIVLGLKNAVTSFIVKSGVDLSDKTDWQSTVIGTPSIQVKGQSLYVNGYIANGASPGYNLYVGGISYITGNITAASFTKSGGTSSQFLKADGSVDSNSYSLSSHTHSYLPLTGGTLSGKLNVYSKASDSTEYGTYLYNYVDSSSTRHATLVMDPTNPVGVGSDYIQLAATSDGNSFLDVPAAGIFTLATTMYIKKSGNVGIGTNNPLQKLEVNGNIKATSFIKSGGTSSQFLKADGSVDSNSYSLTSHNHDSTYLKLSGGTLTGQLRAPLYVMNNGTTYLDVSGSNLVVSPDGTNRYTVWHSGNDGANSGLDADTLDGYHASKFLLDPIWNEEVNVSSEGWYRVARFKTQDMARGITEFFLAIYGGSWSPNYAKYTIYGNWSRANAYDIHVESNSYSFGGLRTTYEGDYIYIEVYFKKSISGAKLIVPAKNKVNNVNVGQVWEWFSGDLSTGGGTVVSGTAGNIISGHTRNSNITSNGFAKIGSSDSYILLGGGGHKAESSLSVSHASSSDNAATATTTDKLSWYNYGRANLDNVKGLNDGSVRYILQGNGIRGLHFSWDGGNYDTQIQIPEHKYNSSEHLKWRSNGNDGTWENWMTILDSSNYTSYSPSLTGTGASGTWGINISGSAASATSAGTATTSTVLLTNNTSQNADACYNEAPGLRFWRYNGTSSTTGQSGGDGWILSWSWNSGSVGGQIYLDDNPSRTMCIRGRNNDANKTFTTWATFLHTGNHTALTNSEIDAIMV